jgi:hypothetical protein
MNRLLLQPTRIDALLHWPAAQDSATAGCRDLRCGGISVRGSAIREPLLSAHSQPIATRSLAHRPGHCFVDGALAGSLSGARLTHSAAPSVSNGWRAVGAWVGHFGDCIAECRPASAKLFAFMASGADLARHSDRIPLLWRIGGDACTPLLLLLSMVVDSARGHSARFVHLVDECQASAAIHTRTRSHQ